MSYLMLLLSREAGKIVICDIIVSTLWPGHIEACIHIIDTIFIHYASILEQSQIWLALMSRTFLQLGR